jgi:hypothetical protein
MSTFSGETEPAVDVSEVARQREFWWVEVDVKVVV